MSKIINAAHGRVQMIVCESETDDDYQDDYQWDHSILVDRTRDGITLKGRDGEVFVPEYAVDTLMRAIRKARSAE